MDIEWLKKLKLMVNYFWHRHGKMVRMTWIWCIASIIATNENTAASF